jgi:transposase
VNEDYVGRQVVGIDLHRHRSVLIRMTESGERLGGVRINNDPYAFRSALEDAGEHPEVVLEATYGWYWAADLLAELGAEVHLAHPLGVKGFAYRRVKNDFLDAADLADLLRMGRLPESWIAPPEVRELRELVRHRAKLVHLCTSLRCQVHAILAGHGVTIPVSDLFGVQGSKLLSQVKLPAASQYRLDSLLQLIESLDHHITQTAQLTADRLRDDPGYAAVQTIPGVGPILGGGVRGRDRRCAPVRAARAAGLVGRPDAEALRVGQDRASGPDHQAGIPTGPLGRGRSRPTRPRGHSDETGPGPDRGPARQGCPPHRHGGRGPGAGRAGVLRLA